MILSFLRAKCSKGLMPSQLFTLEGAEMGQAYCILAIGHPLFPPLQSWLPSPAGADRCHCKFKVTGQTTWSSYNYLAPWSYQPLYSHILPVSLCPVRTLQTDFGITVHWAPMSRNPRKVSSPPLIILPTLVHLALSPQTGVKPRDLGPLWTLSLGVWRSDFCLSSLSLGFLNFFKLE